jgi:CubicO group peptidase (beta-lactamase class C family)
MKKTVSLFLLALLSSAVAIAQTPSFITDSLDRYIERGLKEWNIPGLAIAVVKDGKTVVMKGYGVREVGRLDAVDENTLFIIASNSKLFTGTALAKAEEDKKLSLNDKVTKWFPWFRLYDSNATQMATLRDMLCHRLGTKTFQGDFTFWNSNLPKDSIIYKMRYLVPQGLFRQDYGYCNSGFLVAGEALKKATGLSWEQYVQENILNPLGMNNTYMNTEGIEKRSNLALPYSNSPGNLVRLPFDKIDNLGPATSMVSNVKDMSKWLMMQLDSGKFNGQRVLPWTVLQKTRDGNIMVGSRKSGVYPVHFRTYGLGVFVADYNGKQVYWHTGGAYGYVTNTCFVPEEKLAITILTNNDNQNFFEALRYQILDAYLGVPYTDRSKFQMGFAQQAQKETADNLGQWKARIAKNTTRIQLDQYIGTYQNPVYGQIRIAKTENKEDNKLKIYLQHHPDITGTMEYMDNNVFLLTWSHPGYGIFPAKFTVKNEKITQVEIKVSDFVEFDAYSFKKL